ncbi:MAG: hypothetical protein ABSA40_00605 [Candidatus Dormibacteria bacterium]|jgi:hypothetical protein
MVTLDRLRSLGEPMARAVARQISGLSPRQRHPLAPAAVRVERTKARGGGGTTEQTAVTLWFGEGPELPALGRDNSPWKTAAGLGVTLAGVAAMAAASTLAAQREERRRLARARVVPVLEGARPERRPVTG